MPDSTMPEDSMWYETSKSFLGSVYAKWKAAFAGTVVPLTRTCSQFQAGPGGTKYK